jgi:thiamine biosynthesis lipoprotein
VEAPVPLLEVTRHALGVAEATGGAFDPTMGPLVHRYGFGPITGERAGPETIEAGLIGIAKTQAGATLDLCGIAKGYALDRLVADMEALGATDLLLELGGEVRALGAHPSGRPWQVAVEDPLSPVLAARHVVRPGGLALATSGLTANGVVGPVTVSHVIDPRTARPAQAYAASVSVLAETGMQADALATALLAMGEDGPAFATRAGLAALFIPAAGGESRMTGDFAAFVVA